MEILGIDFGGTGIKGATVNLDDGSFVRPRFRIPTPQPATVSGVTKVIGQIADHFQWRGPLGIAVPSVVHHGITYTAANIHETWVKAPAQRILEQELGLPVTLLNDADAAGLAEMHHGAGRGEAGTVLMLTFGTGIGSAVFRNGQLVPNTEFGHVLFEGVKAEHYASEKVRKQEDLSWKRWGRRVNLFLQYMEMLFNPDLIIFGGGVSKKHEKFFEYIDVRAKLVPALLLNQAGIVGAAMAASLRTKEQ